MRFEHYIYNENFKYIVVDQYKYLTTSYSYTNRLFTVHDYTIGVWRIKQKKQ